jgi:ADP-heptose:LPS heptosyltransferase
MLPGIQEMVKMHEPLRGIPESVVGKCIALKLTGGVGDCVMAIGGTARILAARRAQITAVVMPHMGPLLLAMEGVSGWVSAQRFNALQVQARFDAVFDFVGTFNKTKELREGEYYQLVSDRIGFKVSPGCFDFGRNFKAADRVVALHSGASNPNRRWSNEKWRELAYQLRDRGCKITWLGTRDEFGFNAEDIYKLSDREESLLGQAQWLTQAGYFIGCDSGFLHIAGVLGVPGLGLFGNTAPEHVIGSYPALRGVQCFDRMGLAPTRSLRVDDAASKKLMEGLTVDDVLQATPVSAVECTPQDRIEYPSERVRILLLGNDAHTRGLIHRFLKQYYCVDLEVVEDNPKYDVIMNAEPGCCTVEIRKTQKRATVVTSNLENIRRALRELLNREVE